MMSEASSDDGVLDRVGPWFVLIVLAAVLAVAVGLMVHHSGHFAEPLPQHTTSAGPS